MTFIRIPKLQAKCGDIGRTKVYDLIKKGLLPRPTKIGRASVWDEREIDAALAEIAAKQKAIAGKSH